MKTIRTLAVLVALLAASAAQAASLPAIPGPYDPSQLGAYLNQVQQNVNQYAQGYQPLNYLDNSSMLVNQRGAAERVGGTTSGPTDAEYGPDRWAVDTNVTSGAGYSNEVTSASGVTFAPGLSTMMSVYRKTGTLTQPVCAEQEIKGANATKLQGKPVILSAWIAANAVFPSGGTVTGYLVTGTGTDEGLGVLRSAVGMTASTALTPALTGVATAAQTLSAAPTSTATRYSSGPILFPVTATEAVVQFCFTPGAETAGTTDGFLFTGAQLEEAENAQTTAGRFYRKSFPEDLQIEQRYYAQWADNLAATFTLPMTCTETTSGTTATCLLNFPQAQDLAAPIAAVATATSFGMTKVADGTAEACTTLSVVASTANPQNVKLTCAVSETAAVGTMHIGLYANTGAGNTLTVNSDF